jgi:hypothetical protein
MLRVGQPQKKPAQSCDPDVTVPLSEQIGNRTFCSHLAQRNGGLDSSLDRILSPKVNAESLSVE